MYNYQKIKWVEMDGHYRWQESFVKSKQTGARLAYELVFTWSNRFVI